MLARFSSFVRRQVLQYRNMTDTFTPATFSRLEVAEQAPVIHAYHTKGFVIRDSVVYGSVGLLPRSFFNWKV